MATSDCSSSGDGFHDDTSSSGDEFFLAFAHPTKSSQEQNISEYHRHILSSMEQNIPLSVRLTIQAMDALQHSYEAKQLQFALLELLDLADDEAALKWMEDYHLHVYVLETMKCLMSFLDVDEMKLDNCQDNFGFQCFQAGCALISKLLSLSNIFRRDLAQTKIAHTLISTLRLYSESAVIQTTGINTLAYLSTSDRLLSQLLTPELDVVNHCMCMMGKYPDNDQVQTASCFCLRYCLTGVNISANRLEQLYILIAQCCKRHFASHTVIREIAKLLPALLIEDSNAGHLLKSGLHELIIEAVKLYHSDNEIWTNITQILAAISQNATARSYIHNNPHIKPVQLVNLFFLTLDKDLENRNRHVATWRFLYNIADDLFPDPVFRFEEECLQLLFRSLSQHRDSDVCQMEGLLVLSKLMEYKPHLHVRIGEDSSIAQEPIHTLCLGAILTHGRESHQVFHAACTAIYWIAAANKRLQKLMTEKNTHIAIVDCMRVHCMHGDAVMASAKAIRGLCIFRSSKWEDISQCNNASVEPTEASSNFDMDEALDWFILSLTTFADKPEVVLEVVAAIACLANIEFVRHQCLLMKVHQKIVYTMLLHSDAVLLIECCMEALAILAGAEGAVEAMNRIDVLPSVAEAMRNHKTNYGIQKKGLVLFEILVENYKPKHPAKFYLNLAQTIEAAMSRYITSQSRCVLVEGCVAMQLLAEQGDLPAQCVLDSGCHLQLFSILELWKNDQILQDLATECLIVLVCDRNLKSDLLLSACKRQLLKVVACLVELGADINVGLGSDTPLTAACELMNEELVIFLLEQGIRDIQTPLQLSLERGSHRITGMLLRYLGYDKQAGYVSWSGLNLCSIHPDWFYPTLLTRMTTDDKKDLARPLVAKFERTRKKRQKRLSRDLTDDITGQIGTRLRLRYNLVGNTAMDYNYSPDGWSEADQGRRGSGTQINRKPRSSFMSFTKTRLLNRKVINKADEPMVDVGLLPPAGSPPARSPPGGSPPRRVWRSDTLLYTPPPKDIGTDRYVYIQWTDELDEWRRDSVTGSNVPYSRRDPRQGSRERCTTQPNDLGTSWRRKRDSVYMIVHSCDRKLSAPTATTPIYRPLEEDEGIADTASPGRSQASDTPPSVLEMRNELDTSRDDDDVIDDDRNDYLSSLTPTNRVKVLDISSNKISSIDVLTRCREVHAMFQHLEKLDLGHNKLEDFPEQLFEYMPHLQQLDLRHNYLSTFPVLALTCTKLQKLQLSNNNICDVHESTLPVSVSLVELDMSHNQLATYPAWTLETCPNLQILLLAGNSIYVLPEQSVTSRRLETLNLSHNYIKSIPDLFLAECSALENLHMSGNELDQLPSDTIAWRLTSLSSVLLSDNQLACKEPFYIPKFLLELPALRQLDISHNTLHGLAAPSAWKTKSLRELDVSNNNITKLNFDKGIDRWSLLERLNISKNKLVELPKELGKLTALTSLNFSYNTLINTIPDECGRLIRLFELPLDGLTLHLDEAIVRGKTKDLIGYLHEKLKRSEEHYRIKLMVVGFGGRGKTTLLRSLMKERRSRESIATVGILVKDWNFRCLRNGKSVVYTFNTWDFAGQEEFYSTHQCFLSNRSLYLVVYDLTRDASDELETIRPWLLNIQARAPNCPVMVVGTHKDLLPPDYREEAIRLIESAIREMCTKSGFPGIEDMLTVCATKDNSDVELLRNRMKRVVDNFKIKGQFVMGQKIPASYIHLEKLITSQGDQTSRDRFPVMTHSQLAKIVKDADLDLDTDELRQAVRFLHESGVLLHYDDASLQLRNFYFIDPEWLCRMFAQVVTVREINPFITEAGILRKSDVHLLFTGKKVGKDVAYTFPTSFIPQYLRLLEKFEIALPITNEQLLIPCRLPITKPRISLPNSGCLRREYEMPYFPLGFWSRLITRLLAFLADTTKMIDVAEESPQRTVYWREGIHVLWSAGAYFLIESSVIDDFPNLVIIVPPNRRGYVLLGHVVDHVDALIEEWYPGLTDKYRDGEQLVRVKIPCVKCPRSPPYVFLLDELIDQSKLSDTIACENHEESVPLRELAPDIMLSDFEEKFQIDHSQFKFVKAPEYLLGFGGFGFVYRAQYRQLSVAVKVFSNVGDLSPHKPMRQEATILKRLRHPSLIQMLGVGIQPRVIILELAPLGSLGGLLKNGMHLSRGLQHRIISQTAEGLMYLHKYMVIYRDMKPDNILIFNLSLGVVVNAKIADYGISRFAAPYGFKSTDGTSGFRAPEVTRGETYEFQADVYSMGVTAYAIVTGGRHPFDDLAFRNVHEELQMKPRWLDPFTNKNCAPWPDMEDVISQCLTQVPELRLSSAEFYAAVISPELMCLSRALSVSKHQSVECMAVRRHSNGCVELWMGSGNSDDAQLSWLDLVNPTAEVQGIIFSGRRVLCMCVIGESAILIGCQDGKISVFDAWERQCKHQLYTESGAVLCMAHHVGSNGVDVVMVGLSCGTLLCYDTENMLMNSGAQAEVIYQAGDDVPVKCLLINQESLYVGMGSHVIVVKLSAKPITVHSEWDTDDDSAFTIPADICCMALGKHLYLSKRKRAVVEVWNLVRRKRHHLIKIQEKFRDIGRKNEPVAHCAVTSMLLQGNHTLWLGTHGGMILLLDPVSTHVIALFHRHVDTVRALILVTPQALSSEQQDGASEEHENNARAFSGCVASGGCGYRNILGNRPSMGDEYGFVTIWSLDVKQQVKNLEEINRKRKELLDVT